MAAVAREVANVLKQGFASDETVSSVYETRLKQSACSMAARSVLTKCPPAASPNPCLGCEPLEEDHPALEKGRCPAAFFLLQAGELHIAFFAAQQARRVDNRIAYASERVRSQCPFRTRACRIGVYAHSGIGCRKSKAPPEGSRRG